jgi:hypothetical protein
LRGGDAVLLQHCYEHLGVDHRAGVKEFHEASLARIPQIFTDTIWKFKSTGVAIWA